MRPTALIRIQTELNSPGKSCRPEGLQAFTHLSGITLNRAAGRQRISVVQGGKKRHEREKQQNRKHKVSPLPAEEFYFSPKE